MRLDRRLLALRRLDADARLALWVRYRLLPGASLVALSGAVALSTVAIVGSAPLNRAKVPFVDWVTYAAAASRYFAGSALYDPTQVSGPYRLPDVVLTGYAYPPPSILVIGPFSTYPLGLFLWLLVNALLLVIGLSLVLGKELGLRPIFSVTLASLAVCVLPPFVNGMAAGNANVGLAGLFALSWVSGPGSRRTLGYTVLGAMVKVFPALNGAWFVRGDVARRTALGLGLGFVLLAASVLLQGADIWLDYASALSHAAPACGEALPSLPCALEPRVGSAAKAVALLVAVVMAALAVAIPNRVMAFVAVTAAIQAPVVDMWPHYRLFVLVALWVSLAVLIRRVLELERKRRAAPNAT